MPQPFDYPLSPPRIGQAAPAFGVRCLLYLLLTGAGLMSSLAQAEPPALDTPAAMQLLKARCFSCHTEEKAKGGLILTSHEKLLKGGESGAAIVPGEPDKSPLITVLAADADPHMPPKKQLAPEQIATLASWVKAGAPWDAEALVGKARVVALAPLPASYHPVLAIALSPDAKRLAASCGNDLLLYEIGEKELLPVARASAHPDPIQALVWSPDGTRLATGAFRRVVIWNAAELSAERILRDGLTDRITALRFTPDNQRLIVADGRVSENGTLRLIDPATATTLASWSAHADTIFDLSLSKDGKQLASAGGDRLVKIWDLETQRETARIEAHSSQVLAVAFNPDGTQLVTGGADQLLKVWDVKTRDQIMLLGKRAAGLNCAAWAGTAIFAASELGGVFRYTDFKHHTGAESSESATERKWAPADNAIYSLGVTPDGERAFAGTHDGRVLGWDREGKLTIQHSVNGKTPVTAAK